MLHELPIVLRLKILGNNKILGKSQIWVETYPCAHSPFKKLNFSNSSPKLHKNRYQTFLDLFSFTGFLYLVPNFLSRIIDTIFQLTPTIFFFFWPNLPKKSISGQKRKICTCTCVHGCCFLNKTFPHRGQQTYRYYNVSSPSSRRDN